MKRKVCVEVEESLLKWIEEQIKNGSFNSLSHALESAILYRKKRFGKKPKKKRECAICEKKFIRGWKPNFQERGIDVKEYGICQKCLEEMDWLSSDPKEREEQLKEIFLDSIV